MVDGLLSIGRVIGHFARTDGARLALVENGAGDGTADRMTWAELDRVTNALARSYAALGVGQDDFVAIALPNSAEFVRACVAAWKLGATPMPLPARQPAVERQRILDLARPAMLVGAEAAGLPAVPVGHDPSGFADGELPDRSPTHWKALTSGGSTGLPKIIVTRGESRFSPDDPAVDYLHAGGVHLVAGPLYHNAAFIYAMRGLFCGNQLVVLRRFDPARVLSVVGEHGITWMQLVPTMMNRIWRLPAADREAADWSSLRTLLHVGGPCPPWLKEEFIGWLGAERIVEVYGGTEGQGVTVINGTEWLEHRGSVGRPALGSRFEVQDEHGNVVPPGVVGEVFLMPAGGPGSTYHYIGATPRSRNGWESLGDLGHYDEDGYLYLDDRSTDMIVSGAANVYPAEVEGALDAHPGVRASAVIGLPDDDLGQRVVAIVQADPGVTAAELDAHLTAGRPVTDRSCAENGAYTPVSAHEPLLIANRGEIAVRIARAAAELGIPTVAVYSVDDEGAPHVAKADSAVALRGTGVPGYLDVEDVLRAAVESGADAVHPGYGFLSENARFAAACAELGVRFVGPAPEVLERFGDKTMARELAAELGLPVPAGTGPVDLDGALAFQRELPAPGAVMLKAVVGGGGRGMRAVIDPARLPEAFTRCASEARAAFGDPRVYAEELLVPARHIEVQIVGDGSGAVVALGDRDCSIQRRHQKLVELAPAPGLPEAVRAELAAAAVRIGEAVRYAGVGTVEFIVGTGRIAFCEVNPRLQVEHTVTEEVTGVDLVRTQLELAAGRSLADIGLDTPPPVRGVALQARICTETLRVDGTSTPSAGTLTAFDLPSGHGIRVDAAGHVGYRTSLRFDPLLAKLVVHEREPDLAALAARARRALTECHVGGVETNLDALAGIVAHPAFVAGELDTGFLDRHLAEVLAAGRPHRFVEDAAPPAEPPGPRAVAVPDGTAPVRAAGPGTVVAVEVAGGERVRAGATLVVLEALKMEHVVAAPVAGTVGAVAVAVGDTVAAGEVLVLLEPTDEAGEGAGAAVEIDPDHIRPDLAEVLERHAVGLDERRADAVAKRHRLGLRTARENLADLCDPGSFVEYGALGIAAQRRRRALDDLIERTPADGLVAGTATINAGLVGADKAGAAVLAYDYTVLAGTQGKINHEKKDRIFELAARRGLPVVIFAEGGGGRPGDTDGLGMTGLPTRAFELFARLSGKVPLVGVVAGRCFAGNAALLGCCDVIIAVRGASIGMGGPAMIEGGGLGVVAPDDVGPLSVQVPNGVVDVVADDEAEATALAKRYLSYFQGPLADWTVPDQRGLRHVVPENRVRVYDMRAAVHGLADDGSVLELRRGFGAGMITALVRVEGRPLGLIGNDPVHLGGAIDRDAADKAARFLQLCDAFGLPVVSLCDTPGFMVGTASEREATVRHFSRMFVVGANLTVPIGLVIVRKCYGLGAQAMAGGSLKAPAFAVSWPTGELGGMGLEGAVRLGYRKELEAVEDPAEREALFRRMVDAHYEKGKALSVATVLEVDDVIDPADTRRWITASFPAAPVGVRAARVRPHVDTW